MAPIRTRRRGNGNYHFKSPGFNAFGLQSKASKRLNLVKCYPLEAPEDGIHSLEWANAIVPQASPLLILPYEVRVKIWTFVLHDLSCGDEPIKPVKKGKRFRSSTWPDAARETTALSETCRQIYVDFVGGALLYNLKQFEFSPGLLLNYLWVINPAHKDALRSIKLTIELSYRCKTLNSKALRMLGDCKGLRNLVLEISIVRRIIRHGLSFLNSVDMIQIIENIRGNTALREIKGLDSFLLQLYSVYRGSLYPTKVELTGIIYEGLKADLNNALLGHLTERE